MRRLIFVLACLACGWLFEVPSAQAGFPWRSKPQQPAPQPQTGYAPQIRSYAVVSPTPVGGHYGSMIWSDRRPPTPVYPWGWFGERSSPQGWAHTGYYNNYHDIGLIREQ